MTDRRIRAEDISGQDVVQAVVPMKMKACVSCHQATQFCLADDVANLPRHQINFLLTGIGPNDYTDLREVLLNDQ